jgi:hypothetical protein
MQKGVNKVTKYRCGHETNGELLLNTNELSLSDYFIWAKSIGVFGDKSMCWECYCEKINKHFDETISSVQRINDTTFRIIYYKKGDGKR